MSERSDNPIVIHPAATETSGRGADTVVAPTLLDVTIARTGPDVPASDDLREIESAAPAHARSLALDAFRGLLMIAMVFSFAILGKAGLPAWMYHMQFPPPTEQFRLVAGLTWRDLIFPGFLFTMAAAIPLASSRVLATGMPYPAILWRGAKRAALLFVFALLIGHTNPYWTKDYTKVGNVMAIAGFLACWPLLLHRRHNWDARKFRVFKIAGYVAIATVFAAMPLVYDSAFSLFRKDNIIHALAFCGLVTLGVWLFSQRNVALRAGIVALIVALKLGASYPGWLHSLWQRESWLVEPWFIELLILTLCGSVAGDMLIEWLKRPRTASGAWPRPRLAAIALSGFLVTPVLLVGLYTRNVGATTLIIVAIAALGIALTSAPTNPRDHVLSRLWQWGAAFLVLGMLVEPFEGGIKKDPQTLSFLLLMTGFSFVTLTGLLITSDVFTRGHRVLRPIALAGQNPLLMYLLFSMFLNHLAYLAGVGDLSTTGVLPSLLRALVFTAITTLLVVAATRSRILWKA